MRIPKLDQKQVRAIARKIAPHLDGQHISLQGAVLAELVSIWVNEHDPEHRGRALEDWKNLLADLVNMDATRGAH